MKEYIVTEHHDFPYEEPKPQELIRCKDCAHFAGQPNGYCSLWSDDYLTKYRNAEDYCSDAERKETS